MVEVFENQVEILRANRRSLRADLNRFQAFLDRLSRNQERVSELKSRCEHYRQTYAALCSVQRELEALDEQEANEFDRVAAENEYFANLGSIEEYWVKRNKTTVAEAVEAKAGIASSVRLPQISLPEFSGQYEHWLGFRDTFKSLIHSSTSLDNVQKFYYLKGALKGDAEKSVQSIEISNENYLVAWELLKARYENVKYIKKIHIKGIVDLAEIQRDSHSSFRKFVDEFMKHYRSLKALGEGVDGWNSLLLYLIANKFDSNTKKEWEIATNKKERVTVETMIAFLNDRCSILEAIDNKPANKSYAKHYTHVAFNYSKCKICNNDHKIYQCDKFLKLNVSDRINKIKQLRGCINCLNFNHDIRSCKSEFNCKLCNKRHNTHLHFENRESISRIERKAPEIVNEASTSVTVGHSCSTIDDSIVVLATSTVKIATVNGDFIICRALLDSGSQSNFISSKLFKRLGIKYENVHVPIVGIGGASANIYKGASCTIGSLHSKFEKLLQFFIIDKITDKQPIRKIDIKKLNIPGQIKLSDPAFDRPGDVDILLGAAVFELLIMEQIPSGIDKLLLQNSELGWLIAGTAAKESQTETSRYCMINAQTLNNNLEAFWEIEECTSSKPTYYTREESECESNFIKNHYRDESGRFVVSLPLKDKVSALGDSYKTALSRFASLEVKLNKDPKLRCQYNEFMSEYETLGHMRELKSNSISHNLAYYMPHHCVLRESSLTTRLRVVFNASARTSNNISLNDILMVGPVIQQTLFAILVRFRRHSVAFIADIEKMYRQVKIQPDQCKLQRIVWRPNTSDAIKIYELQTVTYGTASASFLATRCLKQLAIENQERFSDASTIISNDFYVDDLISGSSNVESAKTLISQLNEILASAGLVLRKWVSNRRDLIENCNLPGNINRSFNIIDKTDSCKTLGVAWDAESDSFGYSVRLDSSSCTKRAILFEISRIFDPLGLLAPCIITAKLIIQKLWKSKCDWDSDVPASLAEAWSNFKNEIRYINEISIDRNILVDLPVDIEMHCFADASEAAYGACIYLKSTNERGDVVTSLVAAKTRVAPIKLVSLPRLELCGALLAAQLSQTIQTSLQLKVNKTFYWLDSSIALAWIKSDPGKFKTFVAMRIAKIQKTALSEKWNHVAGSQNPADYLTRGMCPKELKHKTHWWHGPPWLKSNSYPLSNVKLKENVVLPEAKANYVCLLQIQPNFDLFDKFSSYRKLIRVTSYILRFIDNCKNIAKRTGGLSIDEIAAAEATIVKIAQVQSFPIEYQCLIENKKIPNNSKLLNLNVFLDKSSVIRVGGRLSNADLNYDAKHQLLLPNQHKLTRLLIMHEHLKNLHAGPQSLLSAIKQRYWPIRGRQIVKSVLSKCIVCFKFKPTIASYRMADLPATRVNPSRVFSHAGIDLAGPFLIKDTKFRNKKFIKAYVCVFVCFSVKALHLELITDLTTESFLNALKRFVSRRGLCSNIYCDNATNFVGAQRQLARELKQVLNSNELRAFGLENRINWHFNPPRAPHFGGVWEAAVKRVKFHLLRVMKDSRLTYENMYTLLTQIEAILNSRPLCELSEDPNDLQALTPGHFICGTPLTAIPEVASLEPFSVKAFNHSKTIKAHFWRRWSNEYLHTLQQRYKSKVGGENVKIGTLVIIKEDNSPPQHWRLGRITSLFPGKDGIPRVAAVRTINGELKRPVKRLCPLPQGHAECSDGTSN